MWLFYLPVLPWIAWLTIRHRSFLIITAANPGIPLGGFVGESKLEIMRSIAQHALHDYIDLETSPKASTCSYTPRPEDSINVVNANAYRAFLLTSAAVDFSEDKYRVVAERNLSFVLESQNADGSWHYATDGSRDFVDHFHTCFVMKALAKIEALTGNLECTRALQRGVDYYVEHLFDEKGLPKPFSRRPRLTVYRRELYDSAECINLSVLLRSRFPKLSHPRFCLRRSAPSWQLHQAWRFARIAVFPSRLCSHRPPPNLQCLCWRYRFEYRQWTGAGLDCRSPPHSHRVQMHRNSPFHRDQQ